MQSKQGRWTSLIRVCGSIPFAMSRCKKSSFYLVAAAKAHFRHRDGGWHNHSTTIGDISSTGFDANSTVHG